MSLETPLQTMKRLHGSKDKLIAAVIKALDGLDSGGDALDERLAGAPNGRLMRLLAVAETVKARYGTKAKLVEAIATAEGKPKDADYRETLGEEPLPKLLDRATTAERRGKLGKVKAERGKRSKRAAA